MNGKIFISYRHDSEAWADRLYEHLLSFFNRVNIFMDVYEGLQPGDDVHEVIREKVSESGVLLALMGPGWIDTADDASRRRIDDKDDYVRVELESAVENGIRVIPVLLEGASMPRRNQLPPPIRPIANILASRLTRTDFGQDVAKLVKEIKRGLRADTRKRVFKSIVHEAAATLGADSCELFVLDEYGEKIELRASTHKNLIRKMKNGDCRPYGRGQGLTGWIFKTGKPLLIDSVVNYRKKRKLSNRDLAAISDDDEINSEDRFIHGQNLNQSYQKMPERPCYLGVPIKSEYGEVLGVIRVFAARADKGRFERSDMESLGNLARNLSLVLAEEKQEKLKKLLISIGAEVDKERLFKRIAADTPDLVLGRGCSIFLKKKRDESPLELRYTSSEFLADKRGDPLPIRYKLGEGKTGFVAVSARSLLINHYGAGRLDKKLLNDDHERFSKNPFNLVEKVQNQDGQVEGLARLVARKGEQGFSKDEKRKFKRFVEATVYESGTLAGQKNELCETGHGVAAKCFLAVPLKDRAGETFGVIRIPRTYEGGIFTDDDLTFVLAIADRLTSALEPESFLKKNLKVLSEISGEINSLEFDQQQILENILKAVTEELGFEFATIQKVDETRDVIRTEMCAVNGTIRGAVNPALWMQKAEHELNPRSGNRDIQAHVLMVIQEAVVVKGEEKRWLKYLDKEIFDRYNHKELIRAFVPIIAFVPSGRRRRKRKIGTIEAGHSLRRKTAITQTELEILNAFANQAAIAIHNREHLSQEIENRTHRCREVARQVLEEVAEIEGALGELKGDERLVKVSSRIDEARKAVFEKIVRCSEGGA